MTGSQFRALRIKLGKTQQEIATMLGVQRNTVVRWENGTHPVNDLIARFIFVPLAKKYLTDRAVNDTLRCIRGSNDMG